MLDSWLFPTLFFTGFGLLVAGNVLAILYRKPDVKPNYFWNGRPEDAAPSVFFRMSYAKTLIQRDKLPLVYGTTFVGALIILGLAILIIGSTVF